LDGRIQSLSGSCPNLIFRLEGRTVYTTSATKFKEGSCAKLKNTTEVEVKGILMSDGTVRAQEVEREDDDDDDDDD
jgi:hypothetical protein